MTVKSPTRFESLPVWNYKRHGDPTIEQLHVLRKKRRAIRLRDLQRERLLTVSTLLQKIAEVKAICERG